MSNNINFNFNNIEIKPLKYDPDILVTLACAIIFVFSLFFVLIPEKNVEITGNDLEKFKHSLDTKWLDDSLIKSDSLTVRIKETDRLLGKESIKDKMQFLMLVNSIASDNKKLKKEYVDQIILDRKIIISYLVQEFDNVKNTEFSCVLAQCKDKEYKAKHQKMEIIKFVNLQLTSYYNHLKNHGSISKNVVYENMSMNINKALTNKEQQQYEEMYPT